MSQKLAHGTVTFPADLTVANSLMLTKQTLISCGFQIKNI